MGYINPLLRLPAGQALQQLPKADRERIEAVMRDLRDQANTEAETAWRRRKAPMAAYWRAVSTYARHVAHSLASRPTDKLMPNRAVSASADAATMASADVALLLAFIFDRFGQPGDAGTLPDNVVAAVRRLERGIPPQADKDGGQQRAEVTEAQCFAVYQALDEFGRDIDIYEYGLPYLGDEHRQQKAVEIIRAALSASQAEQGERDA